MTRMRGMADLMEGIMKDLRDHQPLQDWLPEQQAVYEAWPNEADRYSVQVVLAAVYDGSTHRGSATRRTARVQTAVVATDRWRRDRTTPTTDMTEILDHCGDRLDVACALPGVVPLGAGVGGGSTFEDVGESEGARVALVADWRMRWTQVRNPVRHN